MVEMTCTHCGGGQLEAGFIEDSGQSSKGYARWIAGTLDRGIFGGARLLGRQRWQVDAYRCVNCAHLELFAGTEV